MEQVKTSYLNENRLPLVLQPRTSDFLLSDWTKANVDFIEDALLEHGAILFRGFGISTAFEFQDIAQSIRTDIYTDYNDLPAEKGTKVYHSTPYPKDKHILFHNESSHMHQWPAKQWFFCQTSSKHGGETPIVDCRKVFQSLDQEIIKDFMNKKLLYTRNFIKGFDVSWQAFFHTQDKHTVEEYCKNNSIDFEWVTNDNLRTYHRSPGTLKHPKTREAIFFNQVQLHHVYFLDPELRESMEEIFEPDDFPRNVYYGDGSPIKDSTMEEILRVYWDLSVKFPWEKGDILMVDNMLVAHARNPYQEEERKILVAMAQMVGLDSMSL